MSVKKILLFPHPALSQPCDPIFSFDNQLHQLISMLFDSLKSSPGVGLAAPQIGVLKRVSVIDLRPMSKKLKLTTTPYVLINPTLIEGEGEQIPREGCLSVPDLLANVKRFMRVKVKTYTAEGNEHVIQADGFEALALQHEIDHLNGILFLDRVTNLRTDIFRRKLA